VTGSLLGIIAAWLLAGIFIRALKHKIGAWPRFCASLAAYQLVPEKGVKPAGILLVVTEVMTVFALLMVHTAGFIAASGLLCIYTAAIVINMLRGRSYIDCGCGDAPTGLSGWLLLRNGVLIILAMLGLLSDIELSMAILLAGIGLAIVAMTLYGALDQLVTNYSLHRRLWSEEV
jgi:hypothetical protein